MADHDIEFITQKFNSNEFVIGYASVLHDAWRATRREVGGGATAEDGQPMRESRMKPSDPNDGDSAQVDIANLPFVSLPPAWQKENLQAAEKALNDIQEITDDGHYDIVDLEEVSARTHVAWKERNTWAEGEQAGSYSEMSSPEKDKDREILIGAVDYVASQGLMIRTVNRGWMLEDANAREIEKLEQHIGELFAQSRSRPDRAAEIATQLVEARLKLRTRMSKFEQGRVARQADRHARDRYDPGEQKVGTEGALLSPPTTGPSPDSEDRSGFKNGESRQDKLTRQKIELLMELGRDEPRCYADAHRIAQEALANLTREYDALRGRSIKKSDVDILEIKLKRIQLLLDRSNSLLGDGAQLSTESLTDAQIAEIKSQWEIKNLNDSVDLDTRRIAGVQQELSDPSLDEDEKSRLARELQGAEWRIGIATRNLQQRGINPDVNNRPSLRMR